VSTTSAVLISAVPALAVIAGGLWVRVQRAERRLRAIERTIAARFPEAADE
jgi:hypothetical protein